MVFYRGVLREHGSISASAYVILDLLMIVAGAYLAYEARFQRLELSPAYRAPVLLACLLALSIFPAIGLYHSWRGRNAIDQARLLSSGWLLVGLSLVVVGFVLKQSDRYSRLWVCEWFLISLACLIAGRLLMQSAMRALRLRGANRRRILIVGDQENSGGVVERVAANPATGWQVVTVALVDYDPAVSLPVERVVCYSERIERLARRSSIDEVWLCLPLDEQKTIDRVLRDFRHSTATMRLMPTLHGMRLIQHPVTEVLGIPMLNLSISPMQGSSRIIKAVEDRVLAALILLVISPLLLVLAIGVKLSSPGPVFFRQKRMGWNGRVFTILKFRSMPVDAEAKTGAVWARRGEKRSTRFGTFLRRTSLDELPQFVNVLRGDMSIVGPRPERPVFVEQFKDEVPGYMQKHMVKAGITGWAQVNGWRGATDLGKRIEHDLYYIEHWSLWFDLKIIFLTIFKGFVHRNAY